TIYMAVAQYRPSNFGSGQDWWITYRDGATNQCTFVFMGNGTIEFRRGDQNGTLLATVPNTFYAPFVWNHFQFRVVISTTIVTSTVRKTAAISDSFSATGVNTQSRRNPYATHVSLTGQHGAHWLDALLFFSGSGAAPNTWVGDVRAVLQT